MQVECAVVSHEGKLRTSNEDNFFLDGFIRENVLDNRIEENIKNKGKKFVFSVCDGMGGEEYGEIASLCSVKAMGIFKKNGLTKQTLEEFIKNTRKSLQLQLPKRDNIDSGTTVTILILEYDTAYIANLGDSRIYLYRNGLLMQISKDHTQAQLMADNGLLMEEEARKHKDWHMLTRYLGAGTDIQAEDFYCFNPLKLYTGDIFLLCSDGLTDMLKDSEIENCIKEYREKEAGRLANELCSNALLAGGMDNITCLVVKIEGLEKKKNFFGKAAEILGIDI